MWSYAFRIADRIAALAGALLLLVAVVARPAAAAQVRIDVAKEGGARVSLALTPFASPETTEAGALRQLLEKDLLIAGYFTLLPIKALQHEMLAIETKTGRINFATWAGWGSELLLRVAFTREGAAAVFKASLYDAGTSRRIYGREYRGKTGREGAAVHAIADDLVRTVTGEPGIALTRIALTWESGGPKRVSVMDYDGRSLRPLSAEGVLSLYPAWFPDGRRLAYVSYRYGRPEIIVHDLEKDTVRSLAFFPGLNAFPAISPDGTALLLTLSRDGNPEIYRMEVDGSALKRLTFTKAVEASPAWSPDGKRIAFVSDRTGSPQVYLMSAGGGRARRISYTGHYATSPDWSPRGDAIVFSSLAGGVFQLFLVDVASGEHTQLTADRGNKEDPSWARNGRHIVYSRGSGTRYRPYIMDTVTRETYPVAREGGNYTSPSWSP